ncbi:MAG: ABC transporter ATP-binding protein [Alphaproteobacteria bacterium]|nr:ABC transporter ATP-binding protein [Alphaproteobacteria bacterium]
MGVSIHVSGVTKLFGKKGDVVEALQSIDLKIEAREFVSILGPSGCGKSTLLRIVGGLIPPTNGSVEMEGIKVRGPCDNVGIVFQSSVLLPWRTVLRNIVLQADIRGLDRQALQQRAQQLLTMCGLEGFENRYPYQLSGGMQQRVSLCRALVHDPSVLLMDEPFAALDAFTREQLMIELQRIWMETQKTVLFITHSIAEAVFLSNRVLVMSARPGRILEELEIDLPRPRTPESMEEPAFLRAVSRARRLLNASIDSKTA